MEVRPGYRRSEVGIIPDEWSVIPIGRVASFASGEGVPVESLAEKSSDAPIPVYGGNGVAGYTAHALTHEPTVVVGRVGQKCGEVYVTDGPVWITDNALYPRRFMVRLDIRYLGLAMQAAGLNDVRNRNDLPLITQSILHSTLIPLPPTMAEQRAIATAISDVDILVDGLTLLIAKKRDLKQAARQKLLSGQARLPGFAGSWETWSLGDMGEFLKGRGVTRNEALSGSIPCVRYGELYTTHHDIVRSFASWITPQVAASATRLRLGDVLFAGSGETRAEIGKCAAFVSDVEAYAGSDIVILRPRGVNPTFLGYLLNMTSVRQQKANLGQGDAVVHISAAALAKVHVSVPSLPEQSAIAAVLSDFDAELEALERRVQKTGLLKQAMMQELLTGRTRLV